MAFFEEVYNIVKKIPEGKVATYGQIAKMLNSPRKSREVGWALHANKNPVAIPCHRVVNHEGYISKSYVFGGIDVQKQLLIKEGIEISDNKIDLNKYQWKAGNSSAKLSFSVKNNFKDCVFIRTEVFVKEQGFDEKQELDGFEEISTHITALIDKKAVGCARLYKEENSVYKIGRVAVLKQYRGKGIGGDLVKKLEEMVKHSGGGKIVIKAQVRVLPFYHSLGYLEYGKEELEEGISHIYMEKII